MWPDVDFYETPRKKELHMSAAVHKACHIEYEHYEHDLTGIIIIKRFVVLQHSVTGLHNRVDAVAPVCNVGCLGGSVVMAHRIWA